MLALTLMLLAAEPPKLRLAIDAPVSLGAAAGWLALDGAAPSLARAGCPCARADVPAFDRFAVDAHFARGGQLANATLALGIAGETLALGLNAPDLASAANDVGIAGEAVALTGLSTELAKIILSRPYPYMFRADISTAQQHDGVNYAAMWSGHTAVLMAAGMATARILDLRCAPLALRVAVWIAGPLLAVAAGALEISQANHFPSDVLVGAVAGGVIGWGVVALHAP